MNLGPLFTALVVTLPALHGCTQSCTEIGCATGVDVKLPQIAATAMLPLTVEICPGTHACATFSVKTGATGLECAGADAKTAGDCFVDPDGTVRAFDFMQGINEATTLDVHVTVRDAADAVLLDGHQTVSLEEHYPNGEACGAACVSGAVTMKK